MTDEAMTDGSSPSWVQRHWKWLIPAGCLGLVVAVVAWGVFILAFVQAGMKRSGAYQDALAAAQSSPAARLVLGEPIEAGWWLTGSIDVNQSSGRADIAFPVSGPEGAGKLYAIGNKRAGRWTLELLELQVEGHDDRVDLLAR